MSNKPDIYVPLENNIIPFTKNYTFDDLTPGTHNHTAEIIDLPAVRNFTDFIKYFFLKQNKKADKHAVYRLFVQVC